MNNLEQHKVLLDTFKNYIEICIEHSAEDHFIIPMNFDDWKKLVWPELRNNTTGNPTGSLVEKIRRCRKVKDIHTQV